MTGLLEWPSLPANGASQNVIASHVEGVVSHGILKNRPVWPIASTGKRHHCNCYLIMPTQGNNTHYP